MSEIVPNIAFYIGYPIGIESGIVEFDQEIDLVGNGTLSADLIKDFALQGTFQGNGTLSISKTVGFEEREPFEVCRDFGTVVFEGHGYLAGVLQQICGNPDWYHTVTFADYHAVLDEPIYYSDENFTDLYPSKDCPQIATVPPALSSRTYFELGGNPFDPSGITNLPPCGFIVSNNAGFLDDIPFASITPNTDSDGDTVQYSVISGVDGHPFVITFEENVWVINMEGEPYPGTYDIKIRAIDSKGLSCDQDYVLVILYPDGSTPPSGAGGAGWYSDGDGGSNDCKGRPTAIIPNVINYVCRKRSLSYDVFVHDMAETLSSNDPDVPTTDSLRFRAVSSRDNPNPADDNTDPWAIVQKFQCQADFNPATTRFTNNDILKPGQVYKQQVSVRDKCGNTHSEQVTINVNLPTMTDIGVDVVELCTDSSVIGDTIANFDLDSLTSISPDSADFREVTFADYTISWEVLSIVPPLEYDASDLNNGGALKLNEDAPANANYVLSMRATRDIDGDSIDIDYDVVVSVSGCDASLKAQFSGINPTECDATAGSIIGTVVFTDGSTVTIQGVPNVQGTANQPGAISLTKKLEVGTYSFQATHISGKLAEFSFNVVERSGNNSTINETKTLERPV